MLSLQQIAKYKVGFYKCGNVIRKQLCSVLLSFFRLQTRFRNLPAKPSLFLLCKCSEAKISMRVLSSRFLAVHRRFINDLFVVKTSGQGIACERPAVFGKFSFFFLESTWLAGGHMKCVFINCPREVYGKANFMRVAR